MADFFDSGHLEDQGGRNHTHFCHEMAKNLQFVPDYIHSIINFFYKCLSVTDWIFQAQQHTASCGSPGYPGCTSQRCACCTRSTLQKQLYMSYIIMRF